MEPYTRGQGRVLQAIIDFFDKHDRPPTTRELAAKLRCHVKTVYQYILALERKGYLHREKGRIRLAPEVRLKRGIPIVGRVAAGTPLLAIENREGELSIEEAFGADREGLFAVRVHGDSMKDVGILNGDIAIVQRSDTVPNDSIAVCYLGEDQDVTVKRFRRRRHAYELLPENPAYPPIHISRTDDHFRIGGQVIGILRALR